MNGRNRLKQDTGVRSLEFCQANPSDAPRFAEFTAGLEAAVAEGRALVSQFGEGVDTAHSTAEHRKLQRGSIIEEVRVIVRVGTAIAVEDPSLRGYFRIGSKGQSNEELLGRGRQLAAKVAELQDRFAGFGYTADKLAAFNDQLETFDAGLDRTNAARSTHIGASAEMDRVADRIMRFVKALNAINRLRFRDDREKLAAWISASSVAWPSNRSARLKAPAKTPAAPAAAVREDVSAA